MENTTAYLGDSKDFPRRLRETDPKYKNARQRYLDTVNTASQVKGEIKEIKDDALASVQYQIELLQGWQAIMEFVNAHYFIQKQMEEARIKSLEDATETWVVLAIPKPKKELHDGENEWCLILPSREAEKTKKQADSCVEFGRFRNGEQTETVIDAKRAG